MADGASGAAHHGAPRDVPLHRGADVLRDEAVAGRRVVAAGGDDEAAGVVAARAGVGRGVGVGDNDAALENAPFQHHAAGAGRAGDVGEEARVAGDERVRDGAVGNVDATGGGYVADEVAEDLAVADGGAVCNVDPAGALAGGELDVVAHDAVRQEGVRAFEGDWPLAPGGRGGGAVVAEDAV